MEQISFCETDSLSLDTFLRNQQYIGWELILNGGFLVNEQATACTKYCFGRNVKH
jgi:hypothetical protein